MKRLRFFLAIVLTAIAMIVPGTVVSGDAPGVMDVLVTFHQPPGPDEVSLIEGLGGTVRTVYHIVPTIAATIPVGSLDELSADPRVKIVEEEIEFIAIFAGEVLPWGVDRVDAELVHPSSNGSGVKVAILDTGIDLDHPDLAVAGNVTFISGTTSGDDDHGHGTLVAGIVGALDNEIGVIGVAPGASLYAVKVLNQNGSSMPGSILSGLQWAVDNNMQVMNMSFGGLMGWPTALTDALDVAYNAGMVIVAGAGNGGSPSGEGNNVWAPARLSSAIAVGATDSLDARYSSSSTGFDLEIVAPGVNINSTAMGGDYGYITGTSASAPHAAGVAALLIASGLTDNVEVRHHMANSAEDLGAAGWDMQFGQGMVNASLALNFSEPPDQTPPTTTMSVNGTINDYKWYRSDVIVTLTAEDNPGGSGVAETRYSLDSGQTWQTYTGPFAVSADGYHQVAARSWDNAGNDEGPVPWVSFKLDQTPPVVTMTSDPAVIQKQNPPGQMVLVSYNGTVSDALSGWASHSTQLIDEHGTYSRDLFGVLSGTAWVEAWVNGADKDGRTYTFRLTASDYAGNSAYVDAITTVVR